MPVEVILPRVDMGMETGTVSLWHAKEGDRVQAGSPLFEIETDKAAMEIEAPATGFLHFIRVHEKQSTAVGSIVAFIFAEGEAVVEPAQNIAAGIAAPTVQSAVAAQPTPRAEAVAGSTIRATPLARRLAQEQGIPLASLKGSGPHGRIVADDVKSAKQAPAPAKPQALAKGVTAIPLDGMRRTIAERLTLSKQTVPHFYLTATCVMNRLMEARAALNASSPKSKDGEPLFRLSVNDFIIKALGMALQRVPAANVTWGDKEIFQHSASDVGVAVAVEGGLFTPVLRNVETKTLGQISKEMKDLAARARARKLAPADYQGGTSAISNLGMYGVEEFSAIINPPHSSILAVGAAVEEFVPENRQPVLRTRMRCTLSCDHRAVDGAVGAQLLQAFRALIEDPMMMLA